MPGAIILFNQNSRIAALAPEVSSVLFSCSLLHILYKFPIFLFDRYFNIPAASLLNFLLSFFGWFALLLLQFPLAAYSFILLLFLLLYFRLRLLFGGRCNHSSVFRVNFHLLMFAFIILAVAFLNALFYTFPCFNFLASLFAIFHIFIVILSLLRLFSTVVLRNS